MIEHDAHAYLVSWLRRMPATRFPNFGCELYIPNVLREFLRQRDKTVPEHQVEQYFQRNAPQGNRSSAGDRPPRFGPRLAPTCRGRR